MISGRSLRRRALLVAGGTLGLLGLAAAVSADFRFLLRAGWEEGRILVRRRSLADLIADLATPPRRRHAFELVLAARAFGADSLGLAAGRTFTTYADIGRDTLVLVLSASPRTELVEYTWWFPLIGRVPYHGYFSVAAAERAAGRLEAAGHDTYLRPAGAFSTLGWFADPLLSTTVGWDSVALAGLVLHEITHNTMFVRDAVPFNESLANFVGLRGTEAFFRAQGDTALAQRAAAEWRDELALAAFYRDLAAGLRQVYRSGATEREMMPRRDSVFGRAREDMAGSLRARLLVYGTEGMRQRPLNNATVVAAQIYRTRLDLFDRVLAAHGGDLRAAIAALVEAVRGAERDDPWAAVEGLLRR